MMRTAAAILAIAWLATGAVADPLAAPGECAQPNQEIVTEPVHRIPAAVAGPAVNHFVPRDGVVTDVVRVLPSLSVVSTEAPSLLDSLTEAVEGLFEIGAPSTDPGLEPVLQPLEPVLQPLEPVTQPLEPVFQPLEPAFQPLEPVLQPLEPVLQPLEPVFETASEPILGILP